MKKTLLLIVLTVLSVTLNAQVAIDLNQLSKMRNVDIRMRLVDSLTNAPVGYATVFLIPQGDTTITHFALTDDKGFVKIEEIVPGKYQVNAEIIGYNPFRKVYDISGYEMNLGEIKLAENLESIDASSITAVGNAVTVKGDTLTYNASSFQVGSNAMLEDLLKKMPGMEVASDGSVKVNGEKVDKITVGGKTFFFNDPAMAVKNLPAKIVDKIKVIDKQKDEAAFSGVGTKDDKEKVMDVQLKEAYREGWFGNAKLSGGSTVIPESERKQTGQPGFVFNGNALLAGFNEKDQITVIGNGKNATNPGEGQVVIFSDFNDYNSDGLSQKMGLETSAQAGANYNTGRIKGFDANASVSYNFNLKDAREKSKTTSFQSSGPDIVTDGEFKGIGEDHRINASMKLDNTDKSKYLFMIRPTFSFKSRDRDIANSSVTETGGLEKNRSVSSTLSHSDIFTTRTDWSMGVKDIGKEGRSLTFAGSYNFRGVIGNSVENSETAYGSYSDIRHLRYEDDEKRHAAEGVLTYVEPVGRYWALQGRFTGCYIGSTNTKNAFDGDDGSSNDYYSAYSKNDDGLFRERLLVQYKKDATTALFGVQLDQEQNVTFSRSLGKEDTVGENDWIFNWAPYADIEWKGDNRRFSFSYGGKSNVPANSQIIPTLDIDNPVQITAGNIYLRPEFSHNTNFMYSGNNPKSFSFLIAYLYGGLSTNKIVEASWFDTDGNRYAIPVNTPDVGAEMGLTASYNTPLDGKKRLTLSLGARAIGGTGTSYQAKTTLPGLDKDNFDYGSMMSRFWGDADGSIFYSGGSGFFKSTTNTVSYSLDASLKYTLGGFTIEAGGSGFNRITTYSLNRNANMNSWDFVVNSEVLYAAAKGWEFGTDCSYSFHKGYSNGYGDPELIWNAGVSKSVKAVTFSLKVADLLNQRKSLYRAISSEYVQDVYRNLMGRYFLLGISFRFGKMNASNNAKAQSAVMSMTF